MKRTYCLIAIIICLFLQITQAEAQTKGMLTVLHDRISNAKLNEIGKRMELDKARIEQIRPLFLKYENEKSALFKVRTTNRGEWSAEGLTDEQAEKMYLALLEKSRKIVDLREKYYHEFRKTLTPREVIKLHRIEMEVNRKMMQTIRKQFNERIPK